MFDVFMEALRAIVVGGILLAFIRTRRSREISDVVGWWYVAGGFGLVFLGTVFDLTDNFPEWNTYVIIGDTEVEAFLEKVVGYLLGFILIAIGVWRWLPKLAEHSELRRRELQVSQERLRVLKATMRTVQDIVNNFLQSMRYVVVVMEEREAMDPETLTLMESAIQETATKLKKLGDLDSTPEKQMAGGVGIDYESVPEGVEEKGRQAS